MPSRHFGLYEETAVRAARQGDELVLHFCHVTSPFEDVARLRFTPHGLELKGRRNVGFADTDYTIPGVRV